MNTTRLRFLLLLVVAITVFQTIRIDRLENRLKVQTVRIDSLKNRLADTRTSIKFVHDLLLLCENQPKLCTTSMTQRSPYLDRFKNKR